MSGALICAACGGGRERQAARYCLRCAGEQYRAKQRARRRKQQGSGTWAEWREARALYKRIVAKRRQAAVRP